MQQQHQTTVRRDREAAAVRHMPVCEDWRGPLRAGRRPRMSWTPGGATAQRLHTCPPNAFNSGEDLVVLLPGTAHSADWTIHAL